MGSQTVPRQRTERGWKIGLHLWVVAVLVAGLVLTVAPARIARADSFTVMNANDSGAGSLRQAIFDANGNGLDDTITFDGSVTSITLTTGELLINSNLTITGPGVTISGNNSSRIFNISNGTVAISGITATSGKKVAPDLATNGQGGAIYVGGGTVALSNMTISGSTAAAFSAVAPPSGLGGGVYVAGGSVTLTNSTITGNSAGSGLNGGRGGGVYVTTPGAVTLVNSTLSGNNANSGTDSGGLGGGLYVASGSATLTASTTSGNQAKADTSPNGGRGGGIYVADGTLTLTNSTISGNTAATGTSFSGIGGGLYLAGVTASPFGSGTLTNSTISSNTATGGGARGGNVFFDAYGHATLANTILALGGASPKNCQTDAALIPATISSNITNSGHNLDDDSSCGLGASNGNISGSPAQLGLLGDNGGVTLPHTQTHVPNLGSPAIDAGDPTFCANPPVSNVDQRGFGRPRDGDGLNGAVCDIGAVEAAEPTPVPSITLLTPDAVAVNGLAFPLTVTGTNFVDGASHISFAGNVLPTTFHSATELQATVPANLITAAGFKQVVVSNDAPGGGTSNTLLFNVDGLVQPIAISPNPLTFPNQQVNTTSVASQITLTNNNGNPLTFSGDPALSGTNGGDFTITFNTCVGNLAPTQSCVIAITFTPSDAGARTATLTITDNAAGSPRTVTINGTGVTAPPPPPPGVTPSSLTFAKQLVNTTSTSKPVKVTNGGSSTLTISAVELAGDNPGDFVIDYNTCTAGLLTNQSCVIAIAFKPTTTGTRSASLKITDNAPDSPLFVPLTGTGAVGSFDVSATASGPGTITPSGISSYDGGSEATYAAAPTGDAIFLGWTLDGVYVGYASPLKFTVNGDRSLVATFVARPSFSDVPTSDQDYQAITFLAAMGIINPHGVNGSGQFQPDRNVVRAEMAAFIARVFSWQAEFHSNTFPDQCAPGGVNCVDNELWNDVAALADFGVVGGYTDQPTCASAGTTAPCYLPRDPVKRVQVLSIIARSFIKSPAQRPTGFWDRMNADLGQYTNVPDTGTQRSDLTTYRTNAGPVPGQASDTTFPDPEGNGLRRFVIEALYQAFVAQFGTDRVP